MASTFTYCCFFAAAILVTTAATASSTLPARILDLIDTRIGSGGMAFGVGSINPGAQVPYGALRLGPDTSAGWEELNLNLNFFGFGGYLYGASAEDIDVPILGPIFADITKPQYLLGFSHTHVDGAGGADWQQFRTIPVRVPAGATAPPPRGLISNGGYKSKWNHSTEVARPGHYEVFLATPNAVAEVTASGTLSGMHRYSCSGRHTDHCALLIDICSAAATGITGKFNEACYEAQIENVTRVSSSVFHVYAGMTMHGSMTGRAPAPSHGVKVFLFAEISTGGSGNSASIPQTWAWRDGAYASSVDAAIQAGATKSHSLGLVFCSNSSSTVFKMRSGISYISSAMAKQNLQQQQRQTADFDTIKAQSQQNWEDLLSRTQISAPIDTYSEPVAVFYSALYREHLSPNTVSESNGKFIGMDQKVHSTATEETRRLSSLSLWDQYRSFYSYLTLSDPAAIFDTAVSMMEMHEEFKAPTGYNSPNRLPKWPMNNVETGSMSGWHSASVLLRACAQNITFLAGSQRRASASKLDCDHVYRVVSSAIIEFCGGHMRQKACPTCYYEPGANVGNNLEFAITAGAVYEEAVRRGDTKTAQAAYPFAFTSLKQMWNSSAKLFCSRAANLGAFSCPEVNWIPYPFNSHTGFIESSAVTYRWYAPHALEMLWENLGGRDAAATSLEKFMQNTFAWPLRNTTLENPWLWVGNEPSLLIPQLFSAMGAKYAHRTSYWVRRVADWRFFYGAAGVPGNDDYGTTTSWYVLNMHGIYPLVPSNDFLITMAPLFNKIQINLPAPPDAGLQLTVISHNRSDSAYLTNQTYYIRSVKVNNVTLSRPRFAFGDLLTNMPGPRHAVLEFTLTTEPVSVDGAPVWVPPAEATTVTENEKAQMRTVAEKITKLELRKIKQILSKITKQ